MYVFDDPTVTEPRWRAADAPDIYVSEQTQLAAASARWRVGEVLCCAPPDADEPPSKDASRYGIYLGDGQVVYVRASDCAVVRESLLCYSLGSAVHTARLSNEAPPIGADAIRQRALVFLGHRWVLARDANASESFVRYVTLGRCDEPSTYGGSVRRYKCALLAGAVGFTVGGVPAALLAAGVGLVLDCYRVL